MSATKPFKSVLYLPFSYGPEFHAGIAQYASEHGWHLNADMAWTGRIPLGWRGDGVIALLTEDPEAARFVRRLRVPVVDIATARPDVRVARVAKDNEAIGRLGARHFLEQGWRDFAFVSRTDNHVCALRLAGFREELRRAGHDCAEIILPRRLGRDLHRWDVLRRELLRELGRLGRPLAVLAFNDYDAAAVTDVCLSAGVRVPEEVGVLGTDNSAVVCSCLPVTLSSVEPETRRVGYRAAELLGRLMEGEARPAEPILVPPSGVARRQSTDRLVIRDPRLARAVEIIVNHLSETFSLEQVAEAAGISRKTLYQLFRRELSQLPAEFIRRRRLELARERLDQGGEPVAEVARACGMPPSTFVRQFRRETGLAPGAWRRREG